MTLELPECEQPEVSVVIVTHGSWPLTERAIEALVAHTEAAFELIVVDNASQDESRAELERLSGVRVILNDRNLGFGPAVNQALEHARAEYLVVLNSDAFVHGGWLEPLLETASEESVGAVVPRFLNRDGTLQEAGALLAGDGTVHLYGDGQDPDSPCYRFRRTIDYGSAACLLIGRDAFAGLGGFDERYAPAYFEDVDLCLRLAQRGLSVVYQPRSTVTHIRHGSGTLDQATELSERNHRVFAQRWRRWLAGRPATFSGASEQTVIQTRDALSTPRLLISASFGEFGARELAGALVERFPVARLTWVVETGQDGSLDLERWRSRGVEVLDYTEPTWLRQRLFHYDAIICGAEVDRTLSEALDRTQPQAPRISLRDLSNPPGSLSSGLRGALAATGIASVGPAVG